MAVLLRARLMAMLFLAPADVRRSSMSVANCGENLCLMASIFLNFRDGAACQATARCGRYRADDRSKTFVRDAMRWQRVVGCCVLFLVFIKFTLLIFAIYLDSACNTPIGSHFMSMRAVLIYPYSSHRLCRLARYVAVREG